MLRDVRDMRARIAAAKQPDGPWDAKIGPGRLQEIELVAQAGALLGGCAEHAIRAGLARGVAINWLSQDESDILDAAYALCWKVQAVAKLLSDKPFDPGSTGEGGCAMMLRETGCDDLMALERRLQELSNRAAQVIDTVLTRRPGG